MVFHEAAAECAMLASGAHLAVPMNSEELSTIIDATPNYNLWLGNTLRRWSPEWKNTFIFIYLYTISLKCQAEYNTF